MEFLMNGLLLAATLFAGGYCWILSKRVAELKSLDKGLGASIVTLTRQIEMARATLEEARGAAKESRQEMSALVARAETASGQLRMLLAAVREPEPPRVRPPAQRVPNSALRAERIPAAPVPEPAPEDAPRAFVPRPAPAQVPPAPAPARAPREPEADADLPKPRMLPPVALSLRKRPEAGPRSEDELLEALSAIASSGGR